MINTLKKRREAFLDQHPGAGDWRNYLFSGATFALYSEAYILTENNSIGRVLDAGAGRGAWKNAINKIAHQRDTIDISTERERDLTWVGDICDMPQVPSEQYDSIICHQVLEHVPRPDRAFAEFFRVLQPGGRLLVSVPHLSRLHELPHDYYRFTENGLKVLVEDAGLEIEHCLKYGGLTCFVHHQFSSMVLTPISIIPILGPIVIGLNGLFSMLFNLIDKVTDRRGMLSTGYIVLARKAE